MYRFHCYNLQKEKNSDSLSVSKLSFSCDCPHWSQRQNRTLAGGQSWNTHEPRVTYKLQAETSSFSDRQSWVTTETRSAVVAEWLEPIPYNQDAFFACHVPHLLLISLSCLPLHLILSSTGDKMPKQERAGGYRTWTIQSCWQTSEKSALQCRSKKCWRISKSETKIVNTNNTENQLQSLNLLKKFILEKSINST